MYRKTVLSMEVAGSLGGGELVAVHLSEEGRRGLSVGGHAPAAARSGPSIEVGRGRVSFDAVDPGRWVQRILDLLRPEDDGAAGIGIAAYGPLGIPQVSAVGLSTESLRAVEAAVSVSASNVDAGPREPGDSPRGDLMARVRHFVPSVSQVMLRGQTLRAMLVAGCHSVDMVGLRGLAAEFHARQVHVEVRTVMGDHRLEVVLRDWTP